MKLPQGVLAHLRAGAIGASLLLCGCVEPIFTSQPEPEPVCDTLAVGQPEAAAPEAQPPAEEPPCAPVVDPALFLEDHPYEYRDPCIGCGRG